KTRSAFFRDGWPGPAGGAGCGYERTPAELTVLDRGIAATSSSQTVICSVRARDFNVDHVGGDRPSDTLGVPEAAGWSIHFALRRFLAGDRRTGPSLFAPPPLRGTFPGRNRWIATSAISPVVTFSLGRYHRETQMSIPRINRAATTGSPWSRLPSCKFAATTLTQMFSYRRLHECHRA